MNVSILASTIIVLALAVPVIVIFRRIHVPDILGYLLIGVVVGPFGLGWVPDVQYIRDLAVFGVVFLMFTIGLEFSLATIYHMKKDGFIYGGMQVLLSAAATIAVALMVGMTLVQSVAVGGIVAMSSTAIVSKQLRDSSQLHASHGRHAIAILLFQDLSVVPFFVVITSLAGGTANLPTVLVWGLVKGIFAMVLILGLGRYLMRPLLRLIVSAKSVELFTLTILLITLGSAWISDNLGLSLALGAFLAGMMLGETEYRQQIDTEIRPFRDVLLALFFITIGMLLDVASWAETWKWVLLLFTALVIFKTILITILGRVLGYTKLDSLRTGIVLAQGGEFGFAILTLALSNQVLPKDYGQVVLGALILSMALAPVLIHYNELIARYLLRDYNSQKP